MEAPPPLRCFCSSAFQLNPMTGQGQLARHRYTGCPQRPAPPLRRGRWWNRDVYKILYVFHLGHVAMILE